MASQSNPQDMFSERFKAFMPFILKEECDYPRDKTGQYSNFKNDPGGPTKWGIDLRGQQSYAPDDHWTKGMIVRLTLPDAVQCYWREYWQGHQIDNLPKNIGECAMNTYVNGGKVTLWLSTCEGSPTRYLDLQEAYYKALVEARPTLRQYLPDWLGRTSRLRSFLGL